MEGPPEIPRAPALRKQRLGRVRGHSGHNAIHGRERQSHRDERGKRNHAQAHPEHRGAPVQSCFPAMEHLRRQPPKSGAFDPPQVGQFEGDKGEFYASDTFEGRAIYIRFVWQNLQPDAYPLRAGFFLRRRKKLGGPTGFTTVLAYPKPPRHRPALQRIFLRRDARLRHAAAQSH